MSGQAGTEMTTMTTPRVSVGVVGGINRDHLPEKEIAETGAGRESEEVEVAGVADTKVRPSSFHISQKFRQC